MAELTINGEVINEGATFDSPNAPWDLVRSRFDNTLGKAEEVYTLLFGAEGDGGMLGEMREAIASAPSSLVTAPTVDTSLTLSTSSQTLPTFDATALQDFPNETYDDPTIATLPSVSTDFTGITAPSDLAFSMSWAEQSLPTVLYSALQTRLMNDLQSGATGLDPIVEAAIYERARTRQQADRLAEWDRINETAGNLQFALPSGVSTKGFVVNVGTGRIISQMHLVTSRGSSEAWAGILQFERDQALSPTSPPSMISPLSFSR